MRVKRRNEPTRGWEVSIAGDAAYTALPEDEGEGTCADVAYEEG